MNYSLTDELTAQRLRAAAASVPAAATYRPDIDGLRAVAIVMVIAYHAFPRLLPGGFTGVDVFFVISGYLITQLVLKGLKERTFSLAGFYQRRVRRIVPALLVLLTACFALAWFALLPGEFRWFGRSLLWCAPFLANIHFAHVTGYFDPGADYNLLLHLWSLGVEEQFYLLWPILLVLAVRYGVTRRVLGAVFVTSFLISLWGARHAPAAHFFLPGARAWELAAGGLLAVLEHSSTQTAPRAPVERLAILGPAAHRAVAGLALIIAGALLLRADEAFPGGWAALPVGGALLLIGAGPASAVSRAFLGSRPLVFVGRLSYSLYLWHWPLFTFTRAIYGPELPPAAIAALLLVASAGAFASYRLVELPLRRGALGRAAVPLLLAGLAAFTLLGAAAADGRLPARLNGPAYNAWEAAATDWRIPGSPDETREFETTSLGTHRAATVLFVGDSHMQQYWPRISWLTRTQPDDARSVRFTAYAGCPMLPGLNSLRQPRRCDEFFTYAMREAWRPEVDTVVFGAFWELYLFGEYQYGVYSVTDPLHRRLGVDSRATQIALSRFERLLGELVASGRRVFIVLSNPTSEHFEPRFLVPVQVRLSLEPPRVLRIEHGAPVDATPFEAFVAPLAGRLREVAARSGAQLLDPRSTLCAGMDCPTVGEDGLPLYIDSNHLRASFARTHAGFIDVTLLAPKAR